MMPTRLDQLHQFYNDDPTDPFNLYALALEYQKTNATKAKEFFYQLMKEHENYLPSYYHFGNLLIALEQNDEAVEILKKGIDLAKQQNELKAMRELRMLLDEALYQ
ncbi:MAG TPA: tetratricopeptide repeat protein [Cyclobacteriaceae bacterium]